MLKKKDSSSRESCRKYRSTFLLLFLLGIIKKLDELSPETAPHAFYVGFKYADPLYTTALEQMEADGVERAVLFPQFPQYSCPTTGSNINNVYRHFSKRFARACVSKRERERERKREREREKERGRETQTDHDLLKKTGIQDRSK